MKHHGIFEQSMQSGTTEENSIITSLTKLTDCSKKYVSENSIEAAGGRFVNENEKKKFVPFFMCAIENLGECIVQKTDDSFVLIVFVLKKGLNRALCLPFVEMTNLKKFKFFEPFPFFPNS